LSSPRPEVNFVEWCKIPLPSSAVEKLDLHRNHGGPSTDKEIAVFLKKVKAKLAANAETQIEASADFGEKRLEPSEGHRIIEIGCRGTNSQAAIFFERRMG
jgi:hypothetical protein